MAFGRSKGLSFRNKRKKVSASAAKRNAVFVLQIIIVLLIAYVLVFCAGMKVTVAGNSMESTLKDGEAVLINRFTYFISDPKPGDVVAFLPKGNEKSHYYIKRIVGTPGDKVQIREGVLYVNGEMFDEEDTEAITHAGLAEEELTVGEDEYFVIGDNRNSSEDSRYANIGNVRDEDIVGKVWFAYNSIRDMGRVK